MATLYGVLLSLLLATAHAQSDFCADVSTRQATHDATVEQEIETKYFALGDEDLPLATANNHDVVEGNCTELATKVFIHFDECAKPNPEGVAYRGHVFRFDSDSVITCVKSLDRHEDGRGGFPVIADGGVGASWLRLEYYSQPYQGLRFYTEIYATLPSK